ncbi:MAG: hypothetical protein PUJ80_07805 [Verrucomicrobiota bacterium]|nr:hypothetical protein [Verrucomicrobiota bacterium]
MNKKYAVAVAVATMMCAGVCLARPGGPGPGRPGPGMHGGGHRGHRPPPPPPRHRHGDSFWGRGGRNFWPGFVGGFVGGAVASTIVEPAPVVVTTPTVVTTPAVVHQPVVIQQPVVVAPVTQVQNVWVEGRYVDQVQANGAVIRVWQPGHYEQRTITVQ